VTDQTNRRRTTQKQLISLFIIPSRPSNFIKSENGERKWAGAGGNDVGKEKRGGKKENTRAYRVAHLSGDEKRESE